MRKSVIMIVKSLLMLFAFLTYSCDNIRDTHSLNIIPLASTVGKYRMLNLSDFATEVKYIPLETNDSALISYIFQISYENEKIFIRNASSLFNTDCYLFDINGKFCNKIGQKGQGPDDYISLSQAFLHEGSIYLTTDTKILIYNVDGLLIKKYYLSSNDIPDDYLIGWRSMSPLDMDRFIMHPVSWKGSYPKAILLEADQSNLKIINEYPNYIALDKGIGSVMTSEAGIMYNYKDDIRSFRILNDTIFTIGKDTIMKDAFIFEFGKYKTPPSFVEGKYDQDYVNDAKKYISPNAIYESSNHLFISFDFGNHAPEPIELKNNQGGKYNDSRVCGVFDKLTGKLTLMKQPVRGRFGFKNDIDGGPVVWPHYISSNNELVSYISVEEFLYYYDKIDDPTPQMTEIAKKISSDDNQIVIIAKLKE